MPEGDVVWRTARRLHAALSGQDLITWDMRWPTLATTDLRGHHVAEVVPAGKHLLMRLVSPDRGRVTLHSHLRMDGSWHVARTPEDGCTTELSLTRGHTVRAVVATSQWTAVGLQLGMLDLVQTADESHLVGHLGPDILGPDWSATQAARLLTAAPDRQVGEALLDQRVIAGIGTFFMAETLFLLGITPWTTVADVPDPDRVIDLAHRLLDGNRHRAVQVTTGDARKGREQYVHARSGKPCRRCGTPVRVARLGADDDAQARVAFWCPSCQRGPAPAGEAPTPLGHRRRPGDVGSSSAAR